MESLTTGACVSAPSPNTAAHTSCCPLLFQESSKDRTGGLHLLQVGEPLPSKGRAQGAWDNRWMRKRTYP